MLYNFCAGIFSQRFSKHTAKLWPHRKCVHELAKLSNVVLRKYSVAGVSTSETWNLLTTNYNKAAQSTIGSIAGLKTVNVNIEEYVTNKALDALFVRIAAEEKEIRTNPAARINDILKKVFGQLDKKK
jgi:predicted nucleic acid-binding protein